MKKILTLPLLALLSIQLATAQKNTPRLFDQAMIINNCRVDITVKGIQSTTWIELEFYNNRDQEIEGLYYFNLHPGQAITGFQLALGDKYRDGSIEERWKARQAYSSIVGKRMDPALLQMTGQNSYSLNIYPVPAKSSRKVKIRIEELLKCSDAGYQYNLDMFRNDSIVSMAVMAKVAGHYQPYIESGVLKNLGFVPFGTEYHFSNSFVTINRPGAISFLLPASCKTDFACVKPSTGDFVVMTDNTIVTKVQVKLQKLRVYWDCSGSMTAALRDQYIGYLKKVLQQYKLSELTIVPFNHQLYAAKTFYGETINSDSWEKFIRTIPFKGATQFGILNFDTEDDLALIFTDGRHNWGKKHSTNAKVPAVYITTGYYNYGYRYYDEYGYPVLNYDNNKSYYLYNSVYDSSSINNLSKFNVSLLSVEDESGNKADIEKTTELLPSNISGRLKPFSKKAILKYGYGNKIIYKNEIDLQPGCMIDDFDKARALLKFEAVMKNNYWYNTLSFGIDNRIVTWQTAYIVLEKIEDYIKFNITPPAEILQDCLDKGYVQTDYRKRYESYKKADAADMLKLVAERYNQRIDLWEGGKNKIDVQKAAYGYAVIEQNENSKTEALAVKIPQNNSNLSQTIETSKSLDEVVVVGYSTTQSRSLTYAVSSITTKQLQDVPVNSVAEALTGRIAGLQVTSSEGAPGADIQLKIRGGSSITEDNSPLYVIDGMAIDDGINSISPQDIERIDVLKDAAATAIYGSRGANGVIIITTKSGRDYSTYSEGNRKLKRQHDVDYMNDIKSVDKAGKYKEYLQLEKKNSYNMCFYTDMAMHFYDAGLPEYTEDIMMKAAELSYDPTASQAALALVYEYMKAYDKAIIIYRNLCEENNTDAKFTRSLAWAYYQDKQYDSAVKILYQGIIQPGNANDQQLLKLKDMMLTEMNMIIALHKDQLHISYIPQEIIKPVTTSLRVIVDASYNNLYGITLIQPGGDEVGSKGETGANDARLQVATDSYTLGEFEVKTAKKGKYRINVNAWTNWGSTLPSLVRITVIRNFGMPTQHIETDIASLNNQQGEIEIADFRIKE